MTNLLPEKERSSLARSIFHRFLLLGSGGGVAAALVFAASLLPAYFALEAERSALADVRANMESPDSLERTERSEGARVRLLLTGVEPAFAATSTVYGLVDAALRAKPAGVSLERIALTAESGMLISGTAPGREKVQAYRTALLADGAHFSAVSVPVASLLGSEEGRFTITLTPVR